MKNNNLTYMKEAINLAKTAFINGEVPIGAVVVYKDKIIGRGYNLRESTNSSLAHAEIIAINEANNYLHSWRLCDCKLFVTIEPCLMCGGAIINSRINEVFFGAKNNKFGAVSSLYQILSDKRLNHQVNVHEGLCEEEARTLMKLFFSKKRK